MMENIRAGQELLKLPLNNLLSDRFISTVCPFCPVCPICPVCPVCPICPVLFIYYASLQETSSILLCSVLFCCPFALHVCPRLPRLPAPRPFLRSSLPCIQCPSPALPLLLPRVLRWYNRCRITPRNKGLSRLREPANAKSSSPLISF